MMSWFTPFTTWRVLWVVSCPILRTRIYLSAANFISCLNANTSPDAHVNAFLGCWRQTGPHTCNFITAKPHLQLLWSFCRCHFCSRPLRLKSWALDDLAVRKDANAKVVVRWYDAWKWHLGTGHLTDFALTSGKATGVWHANRLMSLFKCKFVGDHWSLTP